ncbi:YdcH family protein [Roseovarius sp. B08]|uniref:YdcH family protein n=1 Tax=Roseovarius sp. B08 TaxID=3449223 RepID=UPI003EDC61BE
MSHTPHELHQEFPDMADRITALKTSDAHFARLMDDYHAVNRQVHAAETNVTPVSPAAETDMRKKRARLKDELYAMLTA